MMGTILYFLPPANESVKKYFVVSSRNLEYSECESIFKFEKIGYILVRLLE